MRIVLESNIFVLDNLGFSFYDNILFYQDIRICGMCSYDFILKLIGCNYEKFIMISFSRTCLKQM